MIHRLFIAVLLLLAAIGFVTLVQHLVGETARSARQTKVALLIPGHAQALETAHYRIHYTGTRSQADQAGSSLEKLYAAYTGVFERIVPTAPVKLTLVLYKDRDEFKRNNRSSRSAEAYYLKPACYAYLSAESNPYHWMIHEATHQLAREVSGFRPNRWIDEGLASYFSTSTVGGNELQLGVIDSSAYPIWWIGRTRLSGDMDRDKAEGTFIPLEVLLSGQGGADIDQKFNLYYLGAWSLTHFLFHAEDGRYASAYRKFLARGAVPADFASLIGPPQQIEPQWYRYLQELTEVHGVFEILPAPEPQAASPIR